jgi:hypothetical protein
MLPLFFIYFYINRAYIQSYTYILLVEYPLVVLMASASGFPSRDSNSGLPYSKPMCYCLSHALIFFLCCRPVLIVGPLAEAVVNKLVSDQPHKFLRCQPEYVDRLAQLNLPALQCSSYDLVWPT